jgi:hypothetical protein
VRERGTNIRNKCLVCMFPNIVLYFMLSVHHMNIYICVCVCILLAGAVFVCDSVSASRCGAE